MVKVWWQYLLMFLIAVCSGAAFTILTFSPTDTILETSATGKVVNTIMNTKDTKVDFDLCVNANGLNLKAQGEFLLDTNEETGKPDLRLLLNFNLNEKDTNLELLYKDGIAYFEMDNLRLKFELSDMSGITSLLPMLTPLLSNIELPFDIANIDMGQIQGLVTEAKEQEFVDHYEVRFPLDGLIPGMGTAVIEANLDYMPTKIYLEETNLNDISIEFNATTDFECQNISIEPTTEQQNFKNATNVLEISNLVLGELKKDTSCFELGFSKFGINAQGTLLIKPADLYAELNLNAFDKQVFAAFSDNTIFADAFGMKLKLELDYLKELLNLNLPEFDISKLEDTFDQIKNFDIESLNLEDLITKQTQEINFVEFDENDVPFTTTLYKNTYKISVQEFEINILSNTQNELDKIWVLENGEQIFELKSNKNTFAQTQFDKTEFLDTKVLVDKINFVQDVLNTKKLSADLSLSVDDLSFEAKAYVDFADDLKLSADINVFGDTLHLGYLNDTIFVKFKSLKLSANIDNLEELFEELKTFANQNTEIVALVQGYVDIVKDKIPFEAIQNMEFDPQNIDYANLLGLFDSILVDSQSLTIVLNNSLIKLNFTNKTQNNIQVFANNIRLNLNLTLDKDLEITETDDYLNIANLKPILDFVLDVVNEKQLAGSMDITAFGKTIQTQYALKLNTENFVNSQARFAAKVLNKDLELIFKDQTLFVSFDGVNISITLNELKELLSSNGISFDINKEQLIGILKDKASALLSEFDKSFAETRLLNNILTNDEIKVVDFALDFLLRTLDDLFINFDGQRLLLNTLGSNLCIATTNDKVTMLSLTYGDLYVTTYGFETNFEIETTKTYVTFETIQNYVDAVIANLSQKQIGLLTNFTFDGKDYEATIFADFENELKLKVLTNIFGKNVSITIVGKDAYLTIDNKTFKLSTQDIKDALDIAEKITDFDKEQIQFFLDIAETVLENPYDTALAFVQDYLNDSTFEIPEICIKQIFETLTLSYDFEAQMFENQNLNIFARFENNQASLSIKPTGFIDLGFSGNIKGIENLNIEMIDFEDISAETNFVDIKNVIKAIKGALESAQTENPLENLTLSLSGELNAVIKNTQLCLPLEIYVSLENLKPTAFIKTNILGADLNLSFVQDTIYIDYLGLKVCAELDEIETLKSFIENYAELPEFDLAMPNIELSQEKILDIVDFVLNELEFDITENHINVLGNIFEFNLTFDEKLENLSASCDDFDIDLTFTQSEKPNFDANGYVKLTKLLEVFENTEKDFECKKFVGKVELMTSEQEFEINYQLDLSDLSKPKLHINTMLFENTFDLWLKNDTVYVSYLDKNISITLNDLTEISNQLMPLFENFELQEKATDLINNLKQTVLDWAEALDLGFDLSTLLCFETFDNKLVVNTKQTPISELNNTSISLVFGTKLESVLISNENINLQIFVRASKNLKIFSDKTFDDVGVFVPITKTIANLVESQQSQGTIILNAFDTTIELAYSAELDIQNILDSKLKITSQILGKDLEIAFANRQLFFSFDELNVVMTIDELKELLTKFGIDIEKEIENFGNFDITSIFAEQTEKTFKELEVLRPILGESTSLIAKAINFALENKNKVQIGISNNSLSLSGLGITAQILCGEQIESIKVLSDMFEITLKDFDENAQVAVKQADFVEFDKLYDVLMNTYSYVMAKQYGIKATLNMDGQNYEADIFADLSQNLALSVGTTLFGKDVNIKVFGQEIYVCIDELVIKGNLNELDEILSVVNNYVQIDKQQILDVINTYEDVLTTPWNYIESQISSAQPEFDVTQIANILTLRPNFDISLLDSTNLVLNIAYENYALALTFDEKLLSIDTELNMFGITGASLQLCDFEEITVPQNHVNFDELFEKVEELIDYALSKQYAFDITAVYDQTEYNAKVLIDLNDTLKLKVTTTLFDRNLEVVITGNDVYVTFETYSIHLNINDVDEILDIVSGFMEIDKAQILELVDEYGAYLTNPWQQLENLFNSNMPTIEMPENFDLESILDILSQDINFAITLSASPRLNLEGEYDIHNFCLSLGDNYDITYVGNILGITNFELETCDFEEIIAPTNNIEISNLTKLYDCINTISNEQALAGNGSLTFTLLGNTNTVDINYGVVYRNGKLEGYLTTTFKGINIGLTLLDDTLFVDFSGAKIKIEANDVQNLIGWVNQTFGTSFENNINLDTSGLMTQPSLDVDDILDIVFNKIVDFNLTNTNLSLTIDDIAINLTFDQIIDEISVSFKDILSANLLNTEADLNLDSFDKTQYQDYTLLTNSIDSIISLIESKQANLDAKVDVFRENAKAYSGQISLVGDNTNGMTLAGHGKLTGKDIYEVDLNYQNNYLYVSYNNLKLCASEQSLKELVAIALQAFGIDPNSIGILGEIDDEFIVDVDEIMQFVPDFDLGNPFDILTFIKSFDIDDSTFTVVVDGSKISSNAVGKDITVCVIFENNTLKKVSFNNIYTGVSETEYFDMEVNFKPFTQVTTLSNTSKYIDISGASELVKALVNTAKLDDYKISATVNVQAEIIGIPINMTVNLNAGVKNEDGNLTGYLKISNIPVLPIVNNDVSSSNREVSYYFKDGYVYVYRYDKLKSTFKDKYEKTVKVSISTFLSDIPYYTLKYGIGLSDSIMEAVNEALEKTFNREKPIDISNVLLGYTANGNKTHTIKINMREIANNEQLDTANIKIYTINNSQTENKDYLYKLDFTLNMPLASAVELTVSTNDMTLDDIGSPVDVNFVKTYINNYSFPENAEYEATDGAWQKASNASYTIVFNSNGGSNVSNISGTVGSNITLPTPTRATSTNSDYVTTYTFDGWYISSNLTGEHYFETVSMPRGGLELYAKWAETKTYYYTISFNTNSDFTENSIRALEGSQITLPTYSTKTVVEGNKTVLMQFEGWFSDQTLETAFSSQTMPSANTILYAKWTKLDEEIESKTLKIVDNGTTIYEQTLPIGATVVLPNTTKLDANTEFYYDQSFTNKANFDLKILEEDTTLYIRNKYTLTFTAQYGLTTKGVSQSVTYEVYQGQSIASYVPSAQSTYTEDKSTYEIDHTFVSFGASGTMPNSGTTFNASYNNTEYVWVTFLAQFVKPSDWSNTGTVTAKTPPTNPSPRRYVRNNPTDITGINVKIKYTFKWIFSRDYDMDIAYWSTSGYGTVCKLVTTKTNDSYTSERNANKTMRFNEHTTVYSVWKYC